MKKILVCDDNPDIIFSVKTAFRGLKEYKVSGVESGKNCLDIIKKDNFDLILLDIMMPDMDGIETIKEIRNSNPFQEIISFSALGPESDLKKIVEGMGIKNHLQKPFNNDVLVQVVKETIGDS